MCETETIVRGNYQKFKKAFREEVTNVQIKLWYKRFKDDPESVESDARSGKDLTTRTAENV